MTVCSRRPNRKIDRVRRSLSLALAAGLLLALAPTVDPDGTATTPAAAATASAAAPGQGAPGQEAAPNEKAAPGQGAPTQQELDELEDKAHQQPDDRVRVIVGLNTPAPFTPEADLPPNQRAQQRNNIATQRQALRQELPDHELIQEYETVPYVALALPAQAVQALGRSNRVASVQEDEAVPPTLDDSTQIVQAPTLWSQGSTGSGVMTAVLDTGIDTGHSAFSGRVIEEACYSWSSASHGVSSPCPGGATSITGPGTGGPCDNEDPTCGHGTHVGGIVGSNNSTYPGVARGSNLMSAQVFSLVNNDSYCGSGESPCYLSFTSAQIAALERVYELRNTHNIASANMSLGGGKFTSHCDGDSRKAIIDNLLAVGIPTVIASGNNKYTDAVSMPACISSAVSVGATTKTDTIPDFSNSHPTLVDLLAPGVDIVSTWTENRLAFASGTSMAAPHVAGAFALLRQAKPQLSSTQALADLQSTGLSVTDSRSSPSYSHPRIRIADAANVTSTGTLSGRVTDHDGNFASGVNVQLHNSGGLVAEFTTGTFGWYSFSDLGPGSDYRVRFSHESIGVIWAHGALDEADADQFSVTAGETTTVNAQLPAPPATVSGTVTGPDGPLEDVDVRLHNSGVVATTVTDANGAYELTDLDAGTYALEFDPTAAHPDLEPQWYDGAESQGDATPIELEAGTALTGLGAALAAVPPLVTTGDIAGAVTDSDGPLADVTVRAFNDDIKIAAITTTSADGTYSLDGLEPGNYRLRFSHPSFDSIWWPNAANYATAQPIALTSEGATANLDLAAFASITGTVSGT